MIPAMNLRTFPLLTAAAAAVAVTLAAAGLPRIAAADSDHDRARSALAAGEIRPLAQTLDEVQKRYAGRVIKIELDREHGRWVYELKLLPDNGRVYELEIDAADGRLLRSEGPVQERR